MSHRVNIGCGRSPTQGWLNFDNSPAIKLANSPIRYLISKKLGLLNIQQIENIDWNKRNKILFADATKRIPLKNSSCEYIYSSHMLEHLSQEDASFFLKESFRILENGGVIRIAVPDLKIAVNKYLVSNDADAFMRNLRTKAPPINTFKQKTNLLVVGYRHHQWMYDGASLSKLLTEIGFRDVKICENAYTNIKDERLNLEERVDHSVYVEGTK